MFKRFLRDQSGATAIEYGLIAGIVSVGVISGLTTLKQSLVSTFNNVGSNLTSY
jgi:pilus assembly protein Flp/PilA